LQYKCVYNNNNNNAARQLLTCALLSVSGFEPNATAPRCTRSYNKIYNIYIYIKTCGNPENVRLTGRQLGRITHWHSQTIQGTRASASMSLSTLNGENILEMHNVVTMNDTYRSDSWHNKTRRMMKTHEKTKSAGWKNDSHGRMH